MNLNHNITTLEYWAQHEFLKNPDGTLSNTALKLAFPEGKARSKILAQVAEMGYLELPNPNTAQNYPCILESEFLKHFYEFGYPVRQYILDVAAQGYRLPRDLLFSWIIKLHPEKMEYGRNFQE